jgi:hypothetical protein
MLTFLHSNTATHCVYTYYQNYLCLVHQARLPAQSGKSKAPKEVKVFGIGVIFLSIYAAYEILLAFPFGSVRMFDFMVSKIIIPSLTWIFGLGVAGCVIVIPLCAYKMFRVLFEKDAVELSESR